MTLKCVGKRFVTVTVIAWTLGILLPRGTARAETSFAFALPQPGTTSAGVYDAQGRLVRVLWTMKELPAGPQSATWDGLDAWGQPAAANGYQWRVAVNRSTYRNVGIIGNNGQPPDAAGHTPNGMQSVAVDAAGAVYTANGWDEAGADFKKWDAVGTSVYDARYQIRNGHPNGAPYAIAVDGEYLYCTMGGWNRPPFNSMQQVQRFRLVDGNHAKFTEVAREDGHILVYEWPEKLVPATASPEDAKLLEYPLRSLVVVGDTIFVADALGGRVLRFHKVTGRAQGEFRVALPLALAADRGGRIWIAHEHHTVSVFAPDGGQGRAVLTGLGDVTALAFGPSGTLYVADADAGQVNIYDVTGTTARLLRTFGQRAQPGDAAADHFFRLGGVAVDHRGNLLTINRLPNDGSRLAKWSPEGKLLWERLGLEFVSLGNYGREEPDRFYSMTMHRYRLGDRASGTWEFDGCVSPPGTSYRSDPHGTPRVLRLGGQPFLFLPMGDGVQVYRAGGRVLQLAALVGGKDPTHDNRNHHHPDAVKGEAGMWTWSDRDGNGRVDESEVRWFKHHGEEGPPHYATFGMDVDQDGNIWFCNLHTHSIWEIPRGEFDPRGNPTYDWSQARELAPHDASPLRFEPIMAQHAENGLTYAFGWSALAPSPRNNPFWMGGTTLVCFDRQGQQRWAVGLPETCVGLDTIPGGGCMLGGARSAHIYHYTADGLLVGQMEPGPAMGKQSGWLDNQASVAVNRDPRDRLLDVFVEEDYALRIAWYRVGDHDQTTLRGLIAPPARADREPAAAEPRYYYPVPPANPPQVIEADVCVYGATPGGVTAAVQAARMGKRAVLVEFGRNVGGMTASGLSDTDGGEPAITGGLADEFYARLGKRAKFRPSEAERTFRMMLMQADVPIYFEHRLQSVVKRGRRIVEIVTENGNRFRAAMFIDATYEGDMLARAGVSYTVGREGNAKYGESINGVVFGPKDNFDRPLDPYVVPGKPESGLLPGISAAVPGLVGEGDKSVQAYNFRMWLVPAEQGRPFPKPAGYDPGRYALLLRFIAAGNQHLDLRCGDNNNHHAFNGAFFTDDIGMNYEWPDADYATREKIYQEHVTYQQGLMYFLANDPRVPTKIRRQFSRFGLPKDEFAATGGWPHQLYVREARRMVSDYVMTEHNGTGKIVADDPVALASYQMDSHNTQRVVVDGKVSNEGQTYKAVARPLPFSYRAICPRQSECENLLVVFAVSASHIGLSTLRMEPVLMITGQSAATAACLSIDEKCCVQKLRYGNLRARMLHDGQILQLPQRK